VERKRALAPETGPLDSFLGVFENRFVPGHDFYSLLKNSVSKRFVTGHGFSRATKPWKGIGLLAAAAGAKARKKNRRLSARLKPCPDTRQFLNRAALDRMD